MFASYRPPMPLDRLSRSVVDALRQAHPEVFAEGAL
jgi:hypothetical protein